jgi:hypothetical protein
MTGGTVVPIDPFAQRNLPRISGIGLTPLRLATETTEKSRDGHGGNSSRNGEDDDRRLH